MISQLSVDYTPNGVAIQKGGKPSAVRITMTLNEAYIHTAEDNSASDLIEEFRLEELDEADISDTSNDGESPEHDDTIVRTSDGKEETKNDTVGDDEVVIEKTLSSGDKVETVVSKKVLKDQGFTDDQIAGIEPTAIPGVVFNDGKEEVA